MCIMTNVSRDIVFPVVVAYFRISSTFDIGSMILSEIQIIKGTDLDFFVWKNQKSRILFLAWVSKSQILKTDPLYGAPFQYVFSDRLSENDFFDIKNWNSWYHIIFGYQKFEFLILENLIHFLYQKIDFVISKNIF